ncbi:tyrosine-type recombinase/integrase [Methylocystis sp. IM4]|uniref:tyrosine-type recombinase/integrase n=1 Tax=Methylocystis sp. IM4 TaxID=3136560 RepID=UPI00311A7635
MHKQVKSNFSLTTKEAVAKYLECRRKDVEAGIIVSGRWSTIKTHLEHWLEFIGRDTKIKELERTDCEDYFHSRIKKNKKALPASQTTIANEQSTINAMMRWLFRNNEAVIDGFDFKKLPKIDKKDDTIRRSTFTPAEIDDIGVAIGRYWDRDKNKLDEKEWLSRKLACYYFLIASVTGLRTGEQRQLQWGDLVWTGRNKDGVGVPLIQIKVRAETSKVRQSREFMVRDNGYFTELRQLVTPLYATRHVGKCPVFSLDGEKAITERALLYHFGKIMELAEIADLANRNIVPYSFRHYFITQKLVHGLTHRQVADMCGTSITQIEKTYYHVDRDIMVENALADHGMDNDGIMVRLDDDD